MKIQGDFDSVNLSKGEKSRKIIGDGETRIETVGPISATPAAPSADLLGERKMNAIELVKLVLSKHQMAYAKFHCTEGRKVIESHNMAIGYAAVELEKALALAPDPLLAELEKLVEKVKGHAANCADYSTCLAMELHAIHGHVVRLQCLLASNVTGNRKRDG